MPFETKKFVVSSTNEQHCFVALPKAFLPLSKSNAALVILELRQDAPPKESPPCIYVSWSWDFTKDDTVGISRSLLELLPLRVGEKVHLQISKNLPVALKIHVAPLTVDDSEIIEYSQTEVEEAVPRQLRVAYVGLVFPLYVHRTVLVRLRVALIEAVGDGVDANPPAGYIGPKTEMVVETRARKQGVGVAANWSPRSAIVRLGHVRIEESFPEPVLLACTEMLEAFQWTVGLTLQLTNLSDMAPDLPSSSTKVSQDSPSPEKIRLAALHVEGATKGRPHCCKVALAPDDLEETLRLKSWALLMPNPFPNFSCAFAEPHATPSRPGIAPTPAESHQQGSRLGLSLVAAVYPVEAKWALDFLRVPHLHTPVMDDVLDAPEAPFDLIPRKLSPQVPSAVGEHHINRDFLLSAGANVHLVIAGGKGYGKTTMARAVAESCELYTVVVPCLRLVAAGKGPGQQLRPLAQLKKALYEAELHAPSVLILDDLDALAPAEVTGHDPKLEHLCSLFLDLARSATIARPQPAYLPSMPSEASSGVRVLSVVSSIDALHPMLRKSFLCLNVVALPLPGLEQRQTILRTAAEHLGCTVDPSVLEDVAGRTQNFAPLDLCHVLSRASKASHGGRVSLDDVSNVLKRFTPVSYEGITLLKVQANMAQVGGMKDASRLLYEKLVLPNRFPALFERLPIPMQSGVLLYGPPGCGKTHLIRCILGDAGLNCIAVNGPELLNKYIGASELRVREVFAKAAAARPCVVFFDEFDSIAPKRGHDSTGVTDRVVNQLLCQLDGVEDRTGIFVVAATSRPDLIDAALLRPGRLDKLIRCDMPNAEERAEILNTLALDMVLAPTVDLQVAADWCHGMTPADLAGLLATAHLKAVHELLDALPAKKDRAALNPSGDCEVHFLNAHRLLPDELAALQRTARAVTQHFAEQTGGPALAEGPPPVPEVTQQHLEAAFAETRPSLSTADVAFYAAVYDAFSRPAVALKRTQRATLA